MASDISNCVCDGATTNLYQNAEISSAKKLPWKITFLLTILN